MRRLVLLLALVGCTQSPADRARTVCTTFCDCFYGAAQPTQVESCIDVDCVPQLPPVSDACLDCVYQHESSCGSLEGECTDMCLQRPQPGGP